MKNLLEVCWTWDYGKVYSELKFEDNSIEYRNNKNPPPTLASHDIAHFICGFNGKMEWDYLKMPNHIAEYNAVFMEILLSDFCDSYYGNYLPDIDQISKSIHNYMKWFSEDYYKIKENHPSRKTYIDLQKSFIDKINFDVVNNQFMCYYNVWRLEKKLKTQDFKLSVKMNRLNRYNNENLKSFLEKVITNLKESK